MLKRNPSIQKRRAVTILEVLFSIMIVMVGLVGIAALLPVALRQAGDSFALSRSAVMSSSIAQQVIGSELKNPALHNWLIPDDVGGGVFRIFDGTNLNGVPVSSSPLAATIGLNTGSGFCIDPLYWAAQPGASSGTVPNCAGAEGGYRRARFPYFREDFSPLANPDANFGALPAPLTHPRMLRISLQPNGIGTIPLSTIAAQELCASGDDFVAALNADREAPFVRLYSQASGTSAKVMSTNEFSWMVTLSPNEFGSPSYYTMGVVIFHRRDRGFLAGKATTQGVAYDATMPPDAERIFLATGVGMTPRTTGGSGFSVRLEANNAIDNKVKVGDWLMLSRYLSVGGKPVFRWYRVSAVSPAAAASSSTWERTVYVTGSDWAFSATLPTTATIVSNVASVYERVISIQ